jgi:hypothetical protein
VRVHRRRNRYRHRPHASLPPSIEVQPIALTASGDLNTRRLRAELAGLLWNVPTNGLLMRLAATHGIALQRTVTTDRNGSTWPIGASTLALSPPGRVWSG